MASEINKRDQNFVTVLSGVTNDSDQDISMLRVDPISKRLKISGTISGVGAGIVVSVVAGTNISVNSADPANPIVSVTGINIGNTIGGGTQGSVFFAGTAGVLDQDNANFFWNDANNILRIGNGTTTFTAAGGTGSIMATMDEGNTYYVPFSGQNTNAGTTASTDIVLGADNATDTTNYLDLGISSSGNTDANYTAFGKGAYLYSQSELLGIGTAAAKPIVFVTGGTLTANIRMTILSSGFVGINMAAPARELDMTPLFSGNTIQVNRFASGATNASVWGLGVRNSAHTDSLAIGQSSSTYTTGGTLAWVGNSEAFFYYPATLKIGTGVGVTPTLTLSSALLGTFGSHLRITGDLQQAATGTVAYGERVTDVENANSYYKSNVGLTADTNGGSYILLQSTTSAGGAVSDGIVNIQAYGQGSNTDANSIKFLTRSGANAGVQRMIIDTNGNVVLGSGVPINSVTRLHVVGTAMYMILDNPTATASALSFSMPTSGNPALFYTGSFTWDSQAYSNRGSATGGTTRLHVTSAGLFGFNLGSTVPTAVIDAIGTSGIMRIADNQTDATTKTGRFGIRHYTNAEEDVALAWVQSTATENLVNLGGGSSLHNAATELRFSTAANATTVTGTVRMTIISTGEVGIGVTPTSPLHVSSTVSSAGSNLFVRFQPTLNVTSTDMSGLYSNIIFGGASGQTLTAGYAIRGVINNTSTGTISNAVGVFGSASNASTGTMTSAYAVYSGSLVNGSGTVTTNYGFYGADQTAGTTNYNIYNSQTAGANNWALYLAGTAKSYIGGNLQIVGRLQQAQGVDVGSANDLTLGSDGNTFEITGTTQINAITTANWTTGSMITLLFTSNPTVKHNTAGGGGTAVILLAGAADFVASAGDTLTLRYCELGGVNAWRECGRAVI